MFFIFNFYLFLPFHAHTHTFNVSPRDFCTLHMFQREGEANLIEYVVSFSRRKLYANNITDPTHDHKTKHSAARRRPRKWDGINRSDDSRRRGRRTVSRQVETVNRVSHEPSPALNPIHGMLPRGWQGSSETGWFSDGTGPTGSLGCRRKAPGPSSQARCLLVLLPSPPSSSLRPLEQRKVTFVSTRSRLSNEEPRRLHSCDRILTLCSTANTFFPNRFGYDCRRFYEAYLF